MSTSPVLVTGASGFIAKHCIAELIKQGYSVRGTVRRLERADEVRRAVTRAGADPSGVSFTAADLTRDDGWDAAVAGCSHVLHLASPFPIDQPENRNDVIGPARDGALRVLAAATRAGVERVVLTSSIVAISLGRQPKGHVYTETDWTDPERRDITAYAASKTFAERAAWSFVADQAGGPELTVIAPTFVQGPALDPDLSTSLEVLHLMGRGVYPAAPHVGFPICDVRDVAALEVQAMTQPKAAGERFIVANGFLYLIDVGRLMVEVLPDLQGKVPRFELPDWAVRAAAVFDRRLRAVLPDLGHPRPCSNAKTRETFGFTFRSAEEAVHAAARSLRDLHVI